MLYNYKVCCYKIKLRCMVYVGWGIMYVKRQVFDVVSLYAVRAV